jgi:hypothetical protein
MAPTSENAMLASKIPWGPWDARTRWAAARSCSDRRRPSNTTSGHRIPCETANPGQQVAGGEPAFGRVRRLAGQLRYEWEDGRVLVWLGDDEGRRGEGGCCPDWGVEVRAPGRGGILQTATARRRHVERCNRRKVEKSRIWAAGLCMTIVQRTGLALYKVVSSALACICTPPHPGCEGCPRRSGSCRTWGIVRFLRLLRQPRHRARSLALSLLV